MTVESSSITSTFRNLSSTAVGLGLGIGARGWGSGVGVQGAGFRVQGLGCTDGADIALLGRRPGSARGYSPPRGSRGTSLIRNSTPPRTTIGP